MDSFNENKAVGQLSELLALTRGYCPAKAKQIGVAAVLHDVGKQKIPASILNKPGKLTEHEFEIVKTHTLRSAKMVSNIQGELGEMTALVCLYHHEWQSGGGYWKVPAYYLPEYVSLVSISDVFTALVSRRAYKDAWPPDEALAFIQQQAGTQFTAVLVEVFTNMIRNDSRVPAIFAEVGRNEYRRD
jgi:HD-GYP domain-containing protein (c-di-GMP phosphodiesterase class II)